jgi:hypothetical protein
MTWLAHARIHADLTFCADDGPHAGAGIVTLDVRAAGCDYLRIRRRGGKGLPHTRRG